MNEGINDIQKELLIKEQFLKGFPATYRIGKVCYTVTLHYDPDTSKLAVTNMNGKVFHYEVLAKNGGIMAIKLTMNWVFDHYLVTRLGEKGSDWIAFEYHKMTLIEPKP